MQQLRLTLPAGAAVMPGAADMRARNAARLLPTAVQIDLTCSTFWEPNRTGHHAAALAAQGNSPHLMYLQSCPRCGL